MNQPRKLYKFFFIATFFLLFLTFYNNLILAEKIIPIYLISNFPQDKDVIYSANLAFNRFQDKNNINFKLKFISLNDSWSKQKIKTAIKIAVEESKYIIFTSTSTSFLEIYNFIKSKNILVFACGPTTTQISKIDDNIIRNIPDVSNEQNQIAKILNKKGINKILVLKEYANNPAYTNEAFKYFKKFFNGKIEKLDFSAKTLNFNLKKLKENLYNFSNIYILTGGVINELPIIINFIKNYSTNKNIYLTPWVNIKIIKKFLTKLDNIFYSTYLIPNKKLNIFKKAFLKKYKHLPSFFTSYLTYEIVNIISKTFKEVGYENIFEVKNYILTHKFNTIFGNISFDNYGDAFLKLKFFNITDENKNKFNN